jgi:hypothetical protein
MMHGHEKSRCAIVAVKPTNKCGKAARTDLCGECEVTRIPTATGGRSSLARRCSAFFQARARSLVAIPGYLR